MMFQTRCAGCDAPGVAICTTCRFALVGPRPRAARHGVQAAVPFTGRARDIVLGLKYRNRRQVSRHLAGLVVNTIVANGDHRDLDVVTWAPTSSTRRRARGFDQGELIAGYVARQLGVPSRRLLERRGDDHTQTGRSRRDRLEGVSFRARPGLEGATILVVDDVVTTGATLQSARTSLAGVGAGDVRLYAVASTPAGVASAVRPAQRHLQAVTNDVAA
jgi:predicted amidophosphoribosyltransferase